MFFYRSKINKRNQRITALVTEHGQNAFLLALQHVKDQETANDIVQQCLSKSLQQKELPEEGLGFWFLKIVRNASLDHLRGQQTKQRLSSEIKHHQEQIRSFEKPDNVVQLDQQKELLQNCLNQLKPEQRELIILRDYQDYSYEQIASLLDIPKGTVMSRLHRARLALREQYLLLTQTHSSAGAL